MISLYRPGDSILHRMPAAAKLMALAVIAVLVSLLPVGVIGGCLLPVASSGVLLAAGAGIRGVVAAWWRLRWLILLMGAALWVLAAPSTALQNTGRVVALLLLAEAVTCTTRMGDLLEALQRALQPFQRVGVDPASVALTITLTMAMIPVIGSLLEQVRDAQHARGARLGLRAALPLLVLTMRHADDVSDALAARSLTR